MDELRKAAQALVDSMDDVDTYRPFLGTSQHIALADLRDSLAKSVAAPSKAKPVAVAHMGGMEHGPVEIRVTPYGFDTLRNGRTNLYTLSALKAKNTSAAPQDQDAKYRFVLKLCAHISGCTVEQVDAQIVKVMSENKWRTQND